ncbi:hypothetical protein GO491_01290 [Flavobacteriaceae bacterium Ap0902]|nr:hypothetical protein [Flavobacteriaceae bacterium Ap0902]
MNLRIITAIAILIALLHGCDFKKDEKIEDTVLEEKKMVEDKSSETVAESQTFKTQENWESYYKDHIQGFDTRSFSKEDSFKLYPEATSTVKPIWDPEFNPVYENFIKYNEDSTKYVDFMSYKLQFDAHNELLVSPDQEIVMVDIKNKKVERILFYGPSYWIEDAYFKNDSTLVLLENSTENIPAYQEINLHTNQSTYYTYKEPTDFQSSYLKDRVISLYDDNL